jgi:D-glycero-alpha-D-manno-heptose-7-phosphate kinase
VIVRSRAPLRLGLAGGGTDVSPFCDLYGGNILNTTIDLYAHATLQTTNNGQVEFCATDQSLSVLGKADEILPLNGRLDLHKAVYNRVRKDFTAAPFGIRVTTFCDAPVGSGLGSSSTLVVAMLRAYVELLNLPLGDYEIAHLAYEIEREDVGLEGGKQDQYAATFGGMNFMEFHSDGRVLVNPLRIKKWILNELECSTMLLYTGVSRDSAKIINEQSQNIKAKKSESITAMHAVKSEAIRMKECLLRGELKQFAAAMDAGWEAKKRTAANISNSHIDRIYELAKANGAFAGKVSGAGGGGFMFFLVDPSKRVEFKKALSKEGEVQDCHFTKHGSQAWRVE